jgi:UDP-glucose 4-epimerase
MTIIVTGATGLVGSRLIPRLSASGQQVRALVRDGQSIPGVATVTGDVLDQGSLAAAVQGVASVVHLAAVLRARDPALIGRVNVEGTHNLIAAVQQHAPGARVIMASTGLVYDEDLPRPATETDPASPARPYPASKVSAEVLLRESGLNWSVLRLGFVYGDGDGHLQSAPDLLGSWGWHPAQTLSLVHQQDIATAVVLALTGAFDGHIVNIADDSPTSIYEIAAVVGGSYEASAKPLDHPWMGHLDGTLARSLGFTPTIASIYQAHRENRL